MECCGWGSLKIILLSSSLPYAEKLFVGWFIIDSLSMKKPHKKNMAIIPPAINMAIVTGQQSAVMLSFEFYSQKNSLRL